MNLVSSLSNTALSAYNSLESSAAAATTGRPATQQTDTATGQSQTQDQATFSNVAQQMSQITTSATSQFPGRPGMSTAALIMAPASPGLVTSSKGLTFSEVATDARARLDANYAQMTSSGAPYNAHSIEGRDTASLFGDLDRRSLYAVSSNKDGLFTPEEQASATNIMGRQQGIAMGLYDPNGPQSFGADPAKHYKAGLAFLNNVSAEEKQSAAWLQQHTALEEDIADLGKKDKSQVPKTLFEVLAEMNSEQVDEEQDENSAPGTTASSGASSNGGSGASSGAASTGAAAGSGSASSAQ